MACIRMLGQPRLLDIVDNKWMMDSLPDDGERTMYPLVETHFLPESL